MTEREKYENCKKERELIKDFLYFCLHNKNCYLGNHKEPLDISRAINEYFGIDTDKMNREYVEGLRKEAEKVNERTKV